MAHGRYGLNEFECETIQPPLPNKTRGVPRVDDRRLLNGIFHHLRSGSPWIDLPERYGPRTIVYNRFNRWRKAGVWDQLMDAIIAAHESRGLEVQMIDSTVVRVHQQAAAQKKQSGDYHIGRSRGGLTTKLHLPVDRPGLPLQLELSAREAHDAPMAANLLKDLPTGTSLLADRGYDANWIRELIYSQHCTPVIPPKSNRCDFIYCSKHQYKKGNLVERCFNNFKQFRQVATRYDHHASAYLAFAKLAAVRLLLRFYESTV